MAKAHTIKLQGQEFVTYEGLLSRAHELGLKSIRTRIIQIPDATNGQRAVVMAEVEMDGGKVFSGIGDADPANVNRMIAQHTLRMAETRGKARALRDATNMGMASIEELGPEGPGALVPVASDEAPEAKPPAPEPKAPGSPPSGGATTALPDVESKDYNQLYVESTELIARLDLDFGFLKAYCRQHGWPENRKEMSRPQLAALVKYLRKQFADLQARGVIAG